MGFCPIRVAQSPRLALWILCFMFKLFYVEKKKIQIQFEEYASWKTKVSSFSRDKERVERFIKFIERDDIRHITIQDIIAYRNHLRSDEHGIYEVLEHMKAIRGFLRYFKARKYIYLDPNLAQIDIKEKNGILHDMPEFKRRIGRPANIELIKKVKELRNSGLTYREIGKIVKHNPGRVHRAANYILEE